MKNLRITGVPEHFNFPFVLLENEQPLKYQGIQIEWIEESRGSGQMNLALRNGETDLAILLTESFLKDFEAGNPSKMIGYHVETPLNWGIHVRSGSAVKSLLDLKKKHFLVSRMGSGSHLMALVLAKREVWKKEELTFETVNNMEGAKAAMDIGNEGIFLWEKYTTSPMVENHTMKRIGEVPSPWPCFVMVASEKALAEFGDQIFTIRDRVYGISKSISADPDLAKKLSKFYRLDQRGIENWLEETRWKTEAIVSKSELEDAMNTMEELGILNSKLPLERFLTLDRLNLLD
ncbi:ABC transporter substrate-binding protein [Algoriphagus lacus]|uniref:ABC transporter substrate-binding protein n=1 Tax=Algoriphagus lacus TaxID=2056311 RepID=A0A418PN15_9BACT|nr:ABC transporter substrate-binding protein [Algoriphagus lacus]RIW13186.1 ABC transporter substrate-binding protein [Algoriphagus lacus]